MVTLTSHVGDAITPFLDAVAALRIGVFAEWPYCYSGSLAYEQQYLRSLAQARDALVVIARAGDRVVGASTAFPLVDAPDARTANFAAHGLDVTRG